jgi:NitT/TauT family transport system substrate-binding protein
MVRLFKFLVTLVALTTISACVTGTPVPAAPVRGEAHSDSTAEAHSDGTPTAEATQAATAEAHSEATAAPTAEATSAATAEATADATAALSTTEATAAVTAEATAEAAIATAEPTAEATVEATAEAAALAPTIAATPIPMPTTTLTPVTLFLGFVPNVQFAPIYVAMERGYFAEQGIELSIEHGANETDGLTRIATDNLKFGIVSGEQVMLARSQGAPVTYIFRWYQKFPVGVVVPASSDITDPAQLAGKIVGVPGRFGASYTGFQALLNAVKLKESDLKEVKAIGFDTAPVMCGGQVEASVVYVANEPEIIRAACFDVRVLPIADYANIVSNGLVTNEATISGNPRLVRGMVRAIGRGLEDTIADPKGAMEIAANGKYVQGLKADDALQFKVLTNSVELWRADILGLSDEAAWQLTEDTLKAMGLLKADVDLTLVYTNRFALER